MKLNIEESSGHVVGRQKATYWTATFLTGFCVCLLMPIAVEAEEIASSNFDSGMDGWTKPADEQWIYSYQSNGGNPGGFLHGLDLPEFATPSHFLASSEFLGEWSALDSTGRLSWDHQILDFGSDWSISPSLAGVILTGPGGTAEFTIHPNDSDLGMWIHHDVAIDESEWNVTSGSWLGLLADVTELRIKGELVSNTGSSGVVGDTFGIDNVRLQNFPKLLLGDVNCDGVVDLLDIAPFVELIATGAFEPKADINQDGDVDLLDVGPFVDLLVN